MDSTGEALVIIESLYGAVRALKSDVSFVRIYPNACHTIIQRAVALPAGPTCTQPPVPVRLEHVYLQFDKKLVELAARLTARSLVMHAPPPQVVKRDKNFAIGVRFLLAPFLAQCPNLRSLLLLEPTPENPKAFGARISIVREEAAKAILCEQQQRSISVSISVSGNATGQPEQSGHRTHAHTRGAHTRAASETNADKLPHFSRSTSSKEYSSRKKAQRSSQQERAAEVSSSEQGAQWELTETGEVLAPFALDGSDGANGELLVNDVQHARNGEPGGKHDEELKTVRLRTIQPII